MKEDINLTELAAFLKKRLWLILVLCISGLVLATLYTFYIVIPTYQSTTQILVDQRNTEGVELSGGDINTNIKLIDTYKELISGPAILDEVKAIMDTNLSTKELASRITIEAPENVPLFNVIVTETSPQKAAELANAVAQTFQVKIKDIMQRVDNVVIVYEAVLNTTPVSPNISSNIFRGLLIGFMIGIGIVLLQYFLDDKLRNTEFITEEIGWSNLGTVPEVKKEKVPREKQILHDKPMEEKQSEVSHI